MPEVPAPILARLFFPKAPPHLQRQQFRQLVAALIVGLLVAGTVGGVLIYQASRQ